MAAPSYQLVMRSGPTPGKVYPLEKNELFIGRDLTNDIVINDPEISRRHCRLVAQAGGYVIEDLGSTNGTFVNGQRLTGPYILQPVEMITLGEHVNLAYEAVIVDADATVASSRGVETFPQTPPPPVTPPLTATPVPPPPAAVPQTPSWAESQPVPPPPAYSGQIPQGPVVSVEPPPPPRRRTWPWVLVVILIILLVACVCGAVIWIIDTNSLWCRVLPFIPGCQ